MNEAVHILASLCKIVILSGFLVFAAVCLGVWIWAFLGALLKFRKRRRYDKSMAVLDARRRERSPL